MKNIRIFIIGFCVLLICISGFCGGLQLEELYPELEVPKTTRVIDPFYKLNIKMSAKDIFEICGFPDSDVGSGINIWFYNLKDGSHILIGHTLGGPIIYIQHHIPDSEIVKIL